MAVTQTVTPVCVGDRVEIAVSLFNAQGLIDLKEIRWNPLVSGPQRGFTSPIEAENDDWYKFKIFKNISRTIPNHVSHFLF